MSIIPFGRASETTAPKSARGGGSPKATPRVDFEQLEFAIRAETNKIAKAKLFLSFLRAKHFTGEVEIELIEWVYWQLIDGERFTEDQWATQWRSMSRAMGKICQKKQKRIPGKKGARKEVIVMPGVMQ